MKIEVPKITGDTCGRCKYARELPQGARGPYGADSRLCKRFPPQVTALAVPNGQGGAQVVENSAWPLVGIHTEGCGEYKLKLTIN